MKVLDKFHQIPDMYIVSGVAVGLAIILIYFITTLSSLKTELQSLHEKLNEIEQTTKKSIVESINDGLGETISRKMR